MADLSTLFKYAPTTAAGYIGIDQAQQEQMNRLKQEELADLIRQRAMEASQKAEMHPFELERARLGNQKASAELPGIIGDSSLKQTNAAKAAGTLSSDIEAGNIKNKMQVYQTLGQHLGSMSSAIDGNPSAPPHAVLAQQLQAAGIPDSAAQRLLQKYANVPANELSKKLKEDSDRILRENPDYAKTMDERKMQEEGANKRAAGNNATSIRVAEIQAEARKKQVLAAEQQMDATVQKALQKGPRAGYSAMNAAAEFFRQNGEPDKAAKYTAMAEQIRPQAEAETQNLSSVPGKVDIQKLTNNAVPTAPNRSIAPPGAAQPPSPQKPMVDIKSMAELQQMYPGIPPEKLREAYKRKYGVDLK